MNRRLLAACLAVLVAAAPAFAHAPRPGPNGGLLVDAGTKHHAELVANGTPQVVVFLSDQDDKPVPAAGFRGNAILVIEGKTQRFPLQAGEGNRLVGTAPVPVPIEQLPAAPSAGRQAASQGSPRQP